MLVALRAIIFNSDYLYEFLYCLFNVDVRCTIQTPRDKIKFIFNHRSWKARLSFSLNFSFAENENATAPLSLAANIQAVHSSAQLCLLPDSPQHCLTAMSFPPVRGAPSVLHNSCQVHCVFLQPYLIVSFQGWVLRLCLFALAYSIQTPYLSEKTVVARCTRPAS